MPDNQPQKSVSDDLSKDLEFSGDEYLNMEGENHSTAKEGTLKTPEEDQHQLTGIREQSKDSEAPPDESKKTSLAEDESLSPDEVSS